MLHFAGLNKPCSRMQLHRRHARQPLAARIKVFSTFLESAWRDVSCKNLQLRFSSSSSYSSCSLSSSEGFALIDDDVGLAEDAFPDLPLSQRPAQAAGLSHWEAQRLFAQAAQV